ncbi:MAG TPA: hypothetical protein VGP72_19230 [Planctomycetota bacterium]
MAEINLIPHSSLIIHHSSFLWLLLPLIAALLWLRYYHTRRQELLTGSLLLWRRLAAQQPATPPKRIVIDRSLILQLLALLCLVAALAAPSLALTRERGRGLLVVIDNGPQARAKGFGGERLWNSVMKSVAEMAGRLRNEDTVFVARSAPFPKLLTPQGLSLNSALDLASAQTPALSGPDAQSIWNFATDAARNLPGGSSRLAVAVVSLQRSPIPPANSTDLARWLCVAPEHALIDNVGIIGFGAVPVAPASLPAGTEAGTTQVLARVKNFSAKDAAGSVSVFIGENKEAQEKRDLTLAAGAEQAVVFSVPPGQAVQLVWKGPADSLPEDDSVLAMPRAVRAPRVRFHASVPALEQLFRTALNAELVPADAPATKGQEPRAKSQEPAVDLDVYVGSVPQRAPDDSRGILLLAPESGFGFAFDVGSEQLKWPQAQRDEDDPLTSGIGDSPTGIFPVPKACEILRTGDFKSLIKDARTGRTLVARFSDQQNRFGLLMAMVPGAGMPSGRLLEPPLAAILVRAALQAAGSGDPLIATPASVLEQQSGEPLPLNWRPDAEKNGAGVLDERTSALKIGTPSGQFDPRVLQPLAQERAIDLRPWLIVVALVLLGWEAFGGRKSGV